MIFCPKCGNRQHFVCTDYATQVSKQLMLGKELCKCWQSIPKGERRSWKEKVTAPRQACRTFLAHLLRKRYARSGHEQEDREVLQSFNHRIEQISNRIKGIW